MNREIKFRAWDKNNLIMYDVKRIDFSNLTIHRLSSQYLWEEKFKNIVLMQYICKDKNGKDVYESDILHVYRPKSAPMANNGINRVFVVEDIYTPFDNNCCEVIGNIYENPELLNQKQDEQRN